MLGLKIKFNNYLKASEGFTLSEVLITLAIIGVVAALTIPFLIQNSKNEAIVTGVRKTQSEFQQVYNSFIADGTDIDTVFAGDIQSANVLNQFCTKLNCIKNCGAGTGCFPDVTYKFLDGSDYGKIDQIGVLSAGAYVAATLADGSIISLVDGNGGCDNDQSGSDPTSPLYYSCGGFSIDINGFKGPNQLGRDVFIFFVTRTGVFPLQPDIDDPDDCNKDDRGMTCSYKVLTEGAVNY